MTSILLSNTNTNNFWFYGNRYTAPTDELLVGGIEYTTIESQGNITLVIDDYNYAYAQDSQVNKTAITYHGEHVINNMWGGWNTLCENIYGINSAIWNSMIFSN